MSKPTIFAFNDLLNGADGALDSIDGAILVDKDLAVGVDIDNFYPYQLDDDSGAAENSPLVISPDANAGTKRWLLKAGVFAGLTLHGNIVMPNNGTIGQADGPLLTFNNTSDSLGITGCKVIIGGTAVAAKFQVNTDLDTSSDWWTDGKCNLILRNDNTDGAATLKLVGIPSGIGRIVYGAGSGIDQLIFSSRTASGTISEQIAFNDNGNAIFGGAIPKSKLTIEGTLTLKERAAADGDTAGYGQIFVKNTIPCQLWFRRDDGSEIRIDA